MATFRINYSRVISQANSMRDLSYDLSYEIRNLQNLLGEVRSSWKGPASDAYQRQLVNLISDMNSTRRDMSRVSDTIKSVAERIQMEDERAAERAKNMK